MSEKQELRIRVANLQAENFNLRAKLEAANREIELLRQERNDYFQSSESYGRQLESAQDWINKSADKLEETEQDRDNLQAANGVLRGVLEEIINTEQCKHEIGAKMMEFKMGFAFDRKHYDKYCCPCKCAVCIAKDALRKYPGGAIL